MSVNYSLRPVAPGDEELLFAVFASTRAEELAALQWSPEQVHAFLRQQFHFQGVDWARNFPAATRNIIVVAGQPAGRLYVDRRPAEGELRVVDIALLPKCRGRGVGARIFAGLFAEADARGWQVSIHVEHRNPARRLYDRLGFAPARDDGVYLLMRREPAPTAASARPEPATG